MEENVLRVLPSESNTQHVLNQPKPLPLVMLVFMVSMVSALVGGGGVYLWKQGEIKQITNKLEALDNKPVIVSNTVVPTQFPIHEGLKYLSATEWQEEFHKEFKNGVSCEQFFESHFGVEPNTTVVYSSEKYGYSINFPYNPFWGDNEGRVKLFEIAGFGNQKAIWFGRPYPSEGCTFFRIAMDEDIPSTVAQTITWIDTENQKIKNDPSALQNYYRYENVSGLKYPVLKVEIPNGLFGPVPSYNVFLPSVTLKISDPFMVDLKLIKQLVMSIKTY